MENYVNKLAIVTGASSGIGAGLSRELAQRGCIVIGLARRLDKLQALADEVQKNSKTSQGKFYYLQCDVTNEQQLRETFVKIEADYGIPRILVNNAGVAIMKPFLEMDGESFDAVVNTNAKALFLATKMAVKLMSENSVAGHILNVNSIAGHYMPMHSAGLAYCGSKHMSRIFAEGVREMIADNKGSIKISNISPGLVQTEMVAALPFLKDYQLGPKMLSVEDIVKACISILDTPPNVLGRFEVNTLFEYYLHSNWQLSQSTQRVNYNHIYNLKPATSFQSSSTDTSSQANNSFTFFS